MQSLKISLRKADSPQVNFVQECASAAYSIYIERIGRPPAPMVADFEQAVQSKQLELICDIDTPIGFVISYFHTDHLFVENLAIHPDYQGKSVAREVFGILERRALENDIKDVRLYTNEKMTENLGLYKHLGFEETHRRTENGFHRVYFHKLL